MSENARVHRFAEDPDPDGAMLNAKSMPPACPIAASRREGASRPHC